MVDFNLHQNKQNNFFGGGTVREPSIALRENMSYALCTFELCQIHFSKFVFDFSYSLTKAERINFRKHFWHIIG